MEAHHAAMQRHSLHRNADVAAADAAVAQQAAGYECRSVDADGKTYSLRGEDRRSVHANNSSCGIDQRSAGVAGVKGGIGLDYIVDQTSGIRSQRTSQSAHDACRYRGLKSVGIADRNYELSHAKLLRIAA